MKMKEIELFEKIQMQLRGIYDEMKSLSSKHPDDAINIFKLEFLNQMLADANQILGDENLPLTGFKSFEKENIPSYSDIVFVLSAYLNAFEMMRTKNIYYSLGTWYWRVDGKETGSRTSPPRNLSNKN